MEKSVAEVETTVKAENQCRKPVRPLPPRVSSADYFIHCDGTNRKRPMSEVLRVGVDKGVF